MTRRLSYLLILSCLLAVRAARAASPNELSQEVWQTEQGLPQNTIYALAQTSDGYLWLGTGEGLARYNGVNFTLFDKQNTPQLKTNYIRALLADRQGRLWIATPNGLVRWWAGRFTLFTTADGLTSNSIEKLYLDTAGRLWLTTPNGLSLWQNETWKHYTITDGLPSNNINALAEADGVLWVATTEGLSRWAGGRFTTDSLTPELDDKHITALCTDLNGDLWLGTPQGLAHWHPRWHDDKPTLYTTREGLAHNRINSLATDRTGTVWIGTAGGVSRWTPELSNATEKLSSVTRPASVAGNNILALLIDRENSVWLGTETGGLYQLREQKFTNYTTADGLSSDFVKAVCQDRAGRVWLGTRDAGLNLLENGRAKVFTTRDGLLSDTIQALYADDVGALWVGTPDGLNRWQDGKFTSYTIAEGLSDNFVRSIYADRAGALWIGTRRGLTRWHNGTFTIFSAFDGLANDFVGALYQDRAGALWIGTAGGLSRWQNDEFTTYTTRDGLVNDVITTIYEDATGTLWVGTNGGGLNRRQGEKFTAYAKPQGLFDETVYRILEDLAGTLWLSTKKGIWSVRRSAFDDFDAGRISAIVPTHYDTSDGMRTQECSSGGHPSAWHGNDGRLWFATLKGVAVIDPARIPTNTQPPPVVFESVTIDNSTLPAIQSLEIAPGRTRFDFYYAGLSYVAPAKMRFRYRLEGFDKDWREGGASRVASYTNLPPGHYRLRVVACNNDGVWNQDGATLEFTLKPHFYQTYWFYGLLVLMLASVAGGLYRLRVKRLEAQFSAVLAERSRIAREIHDNLAQEIAGVSVQLEVVARLLEVSSAAARTHLDQARQLVRHSLAEARRYVWDLRSQSLETQDLPAALSDTARRLTANTSIATQVEVSGTFRALPPKVESNLLRIGQEAVNNAVKHGRPTQIVLTLGFTARLVRLRVRDNGAGFAADAPVANGSFGLIGMRERAADIGGTLSVHTPLDAGTEILVEVPLEN